MMKKQMTALAVASVVVVSMTFAFAAEDSKTTPVAKEEAGCPMCRAKSSATNVAAKTSEAADTKAECAGGQCPLSEAPACCRAGSEAGAGNCCQAEGKCPPETAAKNSTEEVTVNVGAGRGPRGPGRGFGPGPHGRSDPAFQEDHNVFFYLLEHRDEIERSVKMTPNGIETLTESDNPDITKRIQEHVAAMYKRVEKPSPIHMRDPLFAAVFRNYDKIEMQMEKTDKGIFVKESSKDPYVAKLIQAHAEVVNLFIANGFNELHRNHELPQK